MITIANDFHGTSYTLARKQVGDTVSPTTLRRVAKALCGVTDCQCGREDGSRGSRYYLETVRMDPQSPAIVRDARQ